MRQNHKRCWEKTFYDDRTHILSCLPFIEDEEEEEAFHWIFLAPAAFLSFSLSLCKSASVGWTELVDGVQQHIVGNSDRRIERESPRHTMAHSIKRERERKKEAAFPSRLSECAKKSQPEPKKDFSSSFSKFGI